MPLGCASFFESIGFRQVAIESDRYKKGLAEFIYSCQKDELVETINNKLLPGIERTLYGVIPKKMPEEHTLLMSLRPDFAELILQGRKTIEFRRKFSKKYEGATVVFYISRPLQQFMFTATIAHVDHNQKRCLWGDYRQEGGISQTVFDSYFSGVDHGYAIRLSNVRALPNQVSLEHVKKVLPKLRPPQSFQRLDSESPLQRVLDLPVHI